MNGVEFYQRGFDITFKVGSVVIDGELYTVDESQTHCISSQGSFHSSFTFSTDSDPADLRCVDFALGPTNDLFLMACDASISEVGLAFVDIASL